MNNLFDQSDVTAILDRFEKLGPGSQRQWGKMNVGQMLAHCTASMETAMGENNIKRILIGRLIAPLIRKKVLGEAPFMKNTPTGSSYKFPVDMKLEEELPKTISSIKKFFDGGPSKCTTYPHAFFGRFTPEQWAIFQWKHMDHHLRQFGV